MNNFKQPAGRRHFIFVATSALLGVAAASSVSAQAPDAYPSGPVTIVVPFAAGTATDRLARLIGDHLTKSLKQTFIVDNKSGANGAIGAAFVAKSPSNGYTLMFTTNTTQVANQHLMKNLSYDPIKDFRPVARIGGAPFVLAAGPAAPAVSSLSELLVFARQNPGKVAYATANSSGIISGSALQKGTGLDIVHVPYRSGPAAITDVLGGQVPLIFVDIQSSLPHIRAGKLKALALTSAKPNPLLPQVPPLATVRGMEGFDLTSWTALFAPAGTPVNVVALLAAEVGRFLADPSVLVNLQSIGFEVMPGGPAELAAFVDTEAVRWKRMIQQSGIQPE